MTPCGAALLQVPRRHIRKRGAESFRHGRMCENGIAQTRIWQARQHSRLYNGHGLAGFGAYHRKAENVVVARSDKRIIKRFVSPIVCVRSTARIGSFVTGL
jgi:hypothetical protein